MIVKDRGDFSRYRSELVKKRCKSTYGYKETIAVNDDGLLLSVDTTSASVHDLYSLSKVLSKWIQRS